MSNTTAQQNAEARAFAIAQIQAVRDAETAKRAESAQAHLESEKAKWNA